MTGGAAPLAQAGLRPRRGLLAVVLLGALLHLLSRVTEGGWLSLGSAGILALPVAALLTPPRLGGLEVARGTEGPVAAGERVRTTLRVTNTGRRASTALVLTDDLPGHESRRVAVPALPPGGEAVVTTVRQALRRTSAGGGTATLTGTTAFGLFTARRVVPVPGRVVVHPARVPLPVLRQGSRAARGRAGSGGTGSPVVGRGGEVLGLRPWRPGDPARAVSVRATARHGRPVVLEREPDDAAVLVVLVGAGAGPAWEGSLAVAAACAVDTVRRGGALVLVGLTAPPHPSPRQVLDAFSAADAAPALSPAALARALGAAHGGPVLLVAADDDPVRPLALQALTAGRGAPVPGG